MKNSCKLRFFIVVTRFFIVVTRWLTTTINHTKIELLGG